VSSIVDTIFIEESLSLKAKIVKLQTIAMNEAYYVLKLPFAYLKMGIYVKTDSVRGHKELGKIADFK
jgi:hypothetical protein